MFSRFTLILGVLLIIAGIVIVFSSDFESFANIIASPFCEEVRPDRFDNIYCINGDNREELSALFGFIGSIVILGGSLIIVAGIFVDMIFTFAQQSQLMKSGEAAEALILDMQHTGVRVNGQPMLKFRLRVTPAYDQPYEAETKRIIPFGMMGLLAIGMTVPVKYDPKKPEDVALDLQKLQFSPISLGGVYQVAVAQSPKPQESLADKLRELEESYKAGLITQQEYETARQRLINRV